MIYTLEKKKTELQSWITFPKSSYILKFKKMELPTLKKSDENEGLKIIKTICITFMH